MVGTLGMLGYGQGGGCACKADWATIESLAGHPLFAGSASHQLGLNDAASMFTRNGEQLVCSVDLIGPVSRSARDFGAISVAHGLSDLFAVGTRPSFALAVAAWPHAAEAVLPEALQGVYDCLAKAGVQILGGHTVHSDQPLLGICAFGFREASAAVELRAGDGIYLTKPVGTGVAIGAIQEGDCPPELEQSALESMLTLNTIGLVLWGHPAVRLISDVTGFGLAGQAIRLARASDLSVMIDGSAIPSFPAVRDMIKQGRGSMSAERNLSLIRGQVAGDDRVALTLAADPQTNGPLLVIADPMIENQLPGGAPLYRVGTMVRQAVASTVTIA